MGTIFALILVAGAAMSPVAYYANVEACQKAAAIISGPTTVADALDAAIAQGAATRAYQAGKGPMPLNVIQAQGTCVPLSTASMVQPLIIR